MKDNSTSGKNSRPRRFRNRGYGIEEMDALDDTTFQRMFRVNRTGFNLLLELIKPKFVDLNDRSSINCKNGNGEPIQLQTKLACVLRWLAGGSYLDICFAFGVSQSYFYEKDGILWPIMIAIHESIPLGFPFSNVNAIEAISVEFTALSTNVLPNCVLAIDGWVCQTRKPHRSENISMSF